MIGIVGQGFVGNAIYQKFKDYYEINTYDLDSSKCNSSEQETLDNDIVFVCLPTPMNSDGSCNVSLVESAIKRCSEFGITKTVVIKSTVSPGTSARINSLYPNMDIVFNPEFLTEKNALVDFVNPPMHVLGGSPIQTHTIELWYNMYSTCNTAPAFHMTPAEASFVKYGVNSFLATKVLWFNQYKDLIEKHGGNYNSVIKAISQDDRIGPSHTKVPGTDGRKGYGGACFPKDTNALLNFSENTFSVLASVIEANNEYRDQYDLDDREKEQNVVYLAGKIVKMSK